MSSALGLQQQPALGLWGWCPGKEANILLSPDAQEYNPTYVMAESYPHPVFSVQWASHTPAANAGLSATHPTHISQIKTQWTFASS